MHGMKMKTLLLMILCIQIDTKIVEGMVWKFIVLSLLFAFDVEPVLTVHNVGLIFIGNGTIRKPKLCLWYYGKEHSKSFIVPVNF